MHETLIFKTQTTYIIVIKKKKKTSNKYYLQYFCFRISEHYQTISKQDHTKLTVKGTNLQIIIKKRYDLGI